MKKGFINFILPFTLFSFMGAFIKYINYFANINLRWISSFFLLLAVIYEVKIINKFKKPEIFIHLILCIWLFLTTLWSSYTTITFYKSIAFTLVSLPIFLSASHWAERKDLKYKLNFMMPCLLLSLVASIAGTIDTSISDFINLGSAFKVYSGIVGNPNALGAIMLMTLPFCLWKLTISKKNIFKLFWITCTFITIITPFLAYSRSSIFGVIFLLIVYLLSRKKSKTIITLLALLSIFSIVFITFPSLDDFIINRYVYKSYDRDKSIIFSRAENWQASFEAAKQGGLLGSGFGVSIGSENVTLNSLSASASGYGREKGNGVLAIIEESGLVGLTLATSFNFYLLLTVKRAYFITKNFLERTLLIILSGSFFAFSFLGVGEAYIVSPGTVEFAIYFAYLGAMSGFSRNLILKNRNK